MSDLDEFTRMRERLLKQREEHVAAIEAIDIALGKRRNATQFNGGADRIRSALSAKPWQSAKELGALMTGKASADMYASTMAQRGTLIRRRRERDGIWIYALPGTPE